MDDFMRYQMERVGTEIGMGCFACLPCEDLDFERALEYMREHPYDDFMHKYLLDITGTFGPNLVDLLIKKGKENDVYLLALMYETCILNNKLHALRKRFDGIDVIHLAQYTPLIYIRWFLRQNHGDNLYWINLLSENTYGHKLLPTLKSLERAVPFDRDVIEAWKATVVSIEDIWDEVARKVSQKSVMPGPNPEQTARGAMEKLQDRGIIAGPEMTTQASLIPHVLLMPWKVDVTVSAGRNQWQLAGIQRSYGKGLDIHEARASYLMEMVERYSAFASFHSDRIPGYKNSYPLIKAPYKDLVKDGHDALDPNDMNLEVPYQNQELYWIPAEKVDQDGHHSIFVPAQLVFLFCNLDEISLTTGLPSNGLAAGNSVEEAKLRALLEVVERDAERVMPYSRQRCFLLESDDPRIRHILKGSAEKGIHIQFLDITSEFGIPCYKAFIQGPGGKIVKGCGAGLDGKRAVVSALTEVPYLYLNRPGSVPEPEGIKAVKYEELPNYASGDVGEDLRLLERLLIMNGYHPMYANLTRADLDIPVVRALVPGLEIITDIDRFSSLGIRQFAHSGYCNGI